MMNYYRRCEICGKIWSFTDADIRENDKNNKMSTIAALGTVASVFGGTRLDTYALNNQMERYDSKIVRLDKCPNCGATSKYVDMSEDEVKQSQVMAQNTHASHTYTINSNASVESLIKRITLFIEDKDFDAANSYCEQVLDLEPENGQVYYLKAFIENKFSTVDEFAHNCVSIRQSKYYSKIIRYGDDSIKKEIEHIDQLIAKEYENRLEFVQYRKDLSGLVQLSKQINLLGDLENDERYMMVISKVFNCAQSFYFAENEKCHKYYEKKKFLPEEFNLLINEYSSLKKVFENLNTQEVEIYKRKIGNDIERLSNYQNDMVSKQKRKKTISKCIVVAAIICFVVLIIIIKPYISNALYDREQKRIYEQAVAFYDMGDYAKARKQIDLLDTQQKQEYSSFKAKLDYEDGLSLFEQNNYGAETVKYLIDAQNLGVDTKKYLAYCYAHSYIENHYRNRLNNIESYGMGDCIADIKFLISCDNFMNASEFLEDDTIRRVLALNGTWENDDGGRYKITDGFYVETYSDNTEYSGQIFIRLGKMYNSDPDNERFIESISLVQVIGDEYNPEKLRIAIYDYTK